ncbi:MAG: rhomboid family intramembrane serine protease [Candidatus Eremiobacteraeota bacterium]|nr:rhomboid family intramembrane serine protease [Candidatus Eremiobacteraeota bacterium]
MLTRILVGINVLVYIWLSLSGGSSDQRSLVDHGAIYGPSVAHGEYWRILTGTFLHSGILHIVLNMLALYQVGSLVEYLLGSPRMLAVYFLSALGAGFAVLRFNFDVPVVGASGAIFGLFGALLAIGMRLGPRGRTLVSQALPIIILNILFGFSMKNIANSAHIGGLATGFIAGLLLFVMPKVPQAEEA